jgi:hypothetical protein
MATIVVNTDNSINVEQFISSLYLYKGVQKVALEENLSYPRLDKSISEAQSGKTIRCKNVSELMQKLNS